ncbi:MAG: hypothetical protein D6731_17205 [Planctomycetota bacterium]|nr:MAG: hypothetical protein D6731_17205 [Planctomycetota bacterium]
MENAAQDQAALVGSSIDVWRLERVVGRRPGQVLYYGRPAGGSVTPALLAVVPPGPQRREGTARLRREVELLRHAHPAENLVGLLAEGLDAAPYPWAAFEWVPGGSLAEALSAGRTFSLAGALGIATGIFRALTILHRRGILLPRLSPRTILLGPKGTVRLTGLADALQRPPDAAEPTSAGGVAEDLRAAGAILYRLLSGEDPAPGRPLPLSSRLPDIPAQLDVLVARLLAENPASRPEAAACLEIVGWLRSRGPTADPDTEPEQHTTDTVLPVSLELAVGDVLDGYVVERELGRGGMGITYAVRDDAGQRYALKVAGFRFRSAQKAREQLRRDAAHAAAVAGHPCVARVYGLGETEVRGVPVVYLRSAFVAGPSLARLVEQHGPLPLPALRHLWVRVAEGLEAIHQAGVVHLDLKPGNILLDRPIDPDRPLEEQLLAATPRVIDFGISRRLDEDSETATALEGTPFYMSPEQCEGLRPGPAADIYTLGTTFFHLATGAPPFAGEQLAVLSQQVTSPPPVAELPGRLGYHLSLVISRCLFKDPQARYPSAGDLLADLRRAGGRDFPRRTLEFLREREHLFLSGRAPRRAPPSSSHKFLRERRAGCAELAELLAAVARPDPSPKALRRRRDWIAELLDELRESLLDDPHATRVELEVIERVVLPRLRSAAEELADDELIADLHQAARTACELEALCDVRALTLEERWRGASAALARLEETGSTNRLARVRVERDLDQRLAELRWDLRESSARIDGLLADGQLEWARQELRSFERRHPRAAEVEDVAGDLAALRDRLSTSAAADDDPPPAAGD